MSFYLDMTQYAGTIETYESYPVETGKILLYGSSFFRNWGYDRAKEQWKRYAGLDVVNHGFGTSSADDLLYYYDRMVRPYKPRALVLATMSNDVSFGYGAKDIMEVEARIIQWAKADFPGIPIYCFSEVQPGQKPCKVPAICRENLQKHFPLKDMQSIPSGTPLPWKGCSS